MMKPIFISLFAIAISASPVCAQSSPAAAAPKTSAGESATLTKEERDRAVDYLTQTQKDFLAATDGLSDAQWKFKAAPDRWSIAETAEHIAVTEQMIWELVSGKIMKSPAAPEKAAEAKGKDEIILSKIPDRSRKAQAPEQLKPTGRWATRAALVKDFEGMRAREIAYLAETKEDLRNHFEEHPFLKTMDAYQWLIFNGAHSKRHTAQILEVKADPNFPKS
jgi:DinB superfamily